jgi:hypothetical protein
MSENTHYFVIKSEHYESVSTSLEKAHIDAIFDPCENYPWHHPGSWETIPAYKKWVVVATAVQADQLNRYFDVLAEILNTSTQYWQVNFLLKGQQVSIIVHNTGLQPELSPKNTLDILSRFFSINSDDIQKNLVYQNFSSFLEYFGIPLFDMLDQDIMDIPKGSVVDARNLD